jgi:acyl-coenzyme A thioesterase PaaI-like protein
LIFISSYLKAAKFNETILIDSQVKKSGGKLAFLEAQIFIKDGDSFELKDELLIATASHTKYIQN